MCNGLVQYVESMSKFEFEVELAVELALAAPSSALIVDGSSSAVKTRNAKYANANPMTNATPNLMRDCNSNCCAFFSSVSKLLYD